MDVCTRLDKQSERSRGQALPPGWGTADPLGEVRSLGELVGAIRRLDDYSDRCVVALLGGEARGDRLAVTVIVTALLPLLLARCRHDRDKVDDYVAELALVIATVDVRALERSRRRAAGVLLDRAWDEVRAAGRRPEPVVPVDPTEIARIRPGSGESVEEVAVNRAALAEFRAALQRSSPSCQAAVEAWNSVVDLADRVDRSSVERRRWKYARGVLRRHGSPELAG